MGLLDDVQAANKFDPGKILGAGLSIYFRNFLGFTALAVIVFLPTLVALGWIVSMDMDFKTTEGVATVNSALNFVRWFDVAVGLVLHPILTAALIYGVVQQLSGSPATLGDAISVGFKRMLPALGVGLGVGLVTGCGFVACIAPGFYFASKYWLAVPAAVMESGRQSSFARSDTLTKGLRWKIFAVVFVVMAVQFGVNFALAKAMPTDTPAKLKSQHVVLAATSLLFAVWNAVTVAVGYYEIRRLKEGIDIAQMAAVFD
jgi:hypothetical protein